LANGPLGAAGQLLRGHEHHRASLIDDGGDAPLLRLRDVHGGDWVAAGGRAENVTGSFFHLIAAAEG
jgi:cobyrinic acid a,c-diamide synthase